ncbi:MAG: helix-turn-helix transcriptional regulator [Parcubacteria group bacterium]|nr:helix-turn-helix transcriptional regulator [Parcubacteria group bacterium]
MRLTSSFWQPVIRELHHLSVTPRFTLLTVLTRRAYTVSELAAHCAMRQNLVSHHLSQLKRFHWVVSHRQGRFVRYRVNRIMLRRLWEQLDTLFKELSKRDN